MGLGTASRFFIQVSIGIVQEFMRLTTYAKVCRGYIEDV